MAGEKEFPALLAVKCGQAAFDAFVANAKAIGSTKEIVFRDLVRAFNEACIDGRRPVMPLELSSPGYRVEGGNVVNAPPALAFSEPKVAKQPNRLGGDVLSKAAAKQQKRDAGAAGRDAGRGSQDPQKPEGRKQS